MLDRGYVVAATDYPGLGTPEVHPYLVGESEAHAVLDSVRAARAIPEAAAGARFAAWGHSQGGQAALFTGIEASRYAPELAARRRRCGRACNRSRHVDGGRSRHWRRQQHH